MITGITSALTFHQNRHRRPELPTLTSPAGLSSVHFRYPKLRPRATFHRAAWADKLDSYSHGNSLLLEGDKKIDPNSQCRLENTRRQQLTSYLNLLREIYPRSPLPWTSKCSQSRPRQEKNESQTARKSEGKFDSGLPRCRVCKRIHFTQLGCQGVRMRYLACRSRGLRASSHTSIPALPM